MSLSHAILGFLQQQPLTGYDLKTQCFDISVANFWPADQAQIYRTLDRLEEQGWVESELEIQRDRPNRKVYHITEAGRAELARWLITPQPLPIHREPFLVQLFFAAQLPDETILDLLEQQIAAHEAQLHAYEQIPLPPEVMDNDRELALARLTLDMGIRSETMYLAWLRDAAAAVRRLPARKREDGE
jgi:DNA-binding PadR family transcriptional regulator